MGSGNRNSFKIGLGLEVDKKSVLLIAGTLGQGGAEKQLFLLATNLKNNLHRVEVVAFYSGELWESELKNAGIKVHNFSKKKSRFARLLCLIRIQRNQKFNVIYAFHFYTSLYAGVLGMIFPKCLSIGSIRNDGMSEIRANGRISCLHMHLPKIIIANNQMGLHYIQQQLKLNKSKMKLLKNAIIQLNSNTIIEEHKLTRFVFIGRLVEAKDPQMFIDIVERLIKLNDIAFQADIYGDGDLAKSLKLRIENNNLSKFINMHGNVKNAADNLNSQTILIVTSLHEGTPNVVLEALASGALVVSRNFNGIKELLSKIHPDYENMIFEDVMGAIEIIYKIKDSNLDHKKLKTAGIEYIIENHGLQKQYDSFIEIISI